MMMGNDIDAYRLEMQKQSLQKGLDCGVLLHLESSKNLEGFCRKKLRKPESPCFLDNTFVEVAVFQAGLLPLIILILPPMFNHWQL